MALMLPRSIFYHIPKTGGNWVRAAIARAGIPTTELGSSTNPIANSHNTYPAVDVAGKFKFAFVRHPLSWYASFWSYRMFKGWRNDDILDPCLSDNFETFLRNVLRRFPEGHLTWRYELYVGPPPGQLDFVGRMENLAEDLVQALRTANEEFDEGRLRTTLLENSSPCWPAFSAPMACAILHSERRILERFGYGDRCSGT